MFKTGDVLQIVSSDKALGDYGPVMETFTSGYVTIKLTINKNFDGFMGRGTFTSKPEVFRYRIPITKRILNELKEA